MPKTARVIRATVRCLALAFPGGPETFFVTEHYRGYPPGPKAQTEAKP